MTVSFCKFRKENPILSLYFYFYFKYPPLAPFFSYFFENVFDTS